MKTISIFILVMVALAGTAQNTEKKAAENAMPVFTGSSDYKDLISKKQVQTLDDYLLENLVYPEPKENQTFREGTVVVGFIVEASGDLTHFEVLNSVSPEIDKELIRALKSTEGMWVPGSSKGTACNVKQEASMAFKVSATEHRALQKDFGEIAKEYFLKGSEAFFEKGKTKRALAYFEKGIRYQPYECSLLFMKGACLYDLGEEEAAKKAWDRIKESSCLRNSIMLDREAVVEQIEISEIDPTILSKIEE